MKEGWRLPVVKGKEAAFLWESKDCQDSRLQSGSSGTWRPFRKISTLTGRRTQCPTLPVEQCSWKLCAEKPREQNMLKQSFETGGMELTGKEELIKQCEATLNWKAWRLLQYFRNVKVNFYI